MEHTARRDTGLLLLYAVVAAAGWGAMALCFELDGVAHPEALPAAMRWFEQADPSGMLIVILMYVASLALLAWLLTRPRAVAWAAVAITLAAPLAFPLTEAAARRATGFQPRPFHAGFEGGLLGLWCIAALYGLGAAWALGVTARALAAWVSRRRPAPA